MKVTLQLEPEESPQAQDTQISEDDEEYNKSASLSDSGQNAIPTE